MRKRIFLGLVVSGVCILIFGAFSLIDGKVKKECPNKEEDIKCEIPIPQNIKVNLEYTGELKLGELITLKASAIPDYDVSEMKIGFGYRRYEQYKGGGVKCLGVEEISFGQVKKGEKKEFSINLIIEKEGEYQIGVSAESPVPGRPNQYYIGGASIPKFYVDEKRFEWAKDREERERKYRLLHPEEGDVKFEDGNWYIFIEGKWEHRGKKDPCVEATLIRERLGKDLGYTREIGISESPMSSKVIEEEKHIGLPPSPEVIKQWQLERAYGFMEQKRYDEAEIEWKETLKEYPDDKELVEKANNELKEIQRINKELKKLAPEEKAIPAPEEKEIPAEEGKRIK